MARKYVTNSGDCIGCDKPLKSVHATGLCVECRSETCSKCGKRFTTTQRNKVDKCGKCTTRKRDKTRYY